MILSIETKGTFFSQDIYRVTKNYANKLNKQPANQQLVWVEPIDALVPLCLHALGTGCLLPLLLFSSYLPRVRRMGGPGRWPLHGSRSCCVSSFLCAKMYRFHSYTGDVFPGISWSVGTEPKSSKKLRLTQKLTATFSTSTPRQMVA